MTNDNIVLCELKLSPDKLERFYNAMVTENEKWINKNDTELEEAIKKAMNYEINESVITSAKLAINLVKQVTNDNYEELKTKDQVTTDNYLFQIERSLNILNNLLV